MIKQFSKVATHQPVNARCIKGVVWAMRDWVARDGWSTMEASCCQVPLGGFGVSDFSACARRPCMASLGPLSLFQSSAGASTASAGGGRIPVSVSLTQRSSSERAQISCWDKSWRCSPLVSWSSRPDLRPGHKRSQHPALLLTHA